MGIFGKSKPAVELRPREARGATAPTGGLSIIGAGMTVRGDLETAGVVKVEGTVDGHVKAKAQVLVARGGLIHGNVETAEAVVGGKVSGGIHATERVEVQPGASVEGDITTRKISVAEGGNLNGQIRMHEAAGVGQEDAGSVPQRSGAPAQSRPAVPMTRIATPPHALGQGEG